MVCNYGSGALRTGHNGVTVDQNTAGKEPFCHMPSLFRFLIIAGVLGAVVFGGLYVIGIFLEPEQREMSTPVPGVKIRR
jgi:hypothetical protein